MSNSLMVELLFHTERAGVRFPLGRPVTEIHPCDHALTARLSDVSMLQSGATGFDLYN